MRAFILPFFVLGIFCGLSVPGLHGDDPGPSRRQGKVLLLPNENVLEGDIELIEDRYHIRRSIGETWMPAGQALHLCNSREEAYEFLRGRTNQNDPDECLRLARWCHRHGLRQQAILEAGDALRLRPKDEAASRLLSYLQQADKVVAAPPPPQPPQPLPPAFSLTLTSESLGHYATRVQPILMNACVRCHLPSAPGGENSSFQLLRSHGAGTQDRTTTLNNIGEVLQQIDPERPLESLFLSKAVSLHGGMTQAPFRNRDSLGYRVLEDWVRFTVAQNPQLRQTLPAHLNPTPSPTIVQQPATPAPVRAVNFTPQTPVAPKELPAASPPPDLKGTVLPPIAEPKKPTPVDPFDPEHFNKQMHPSDPPPLPAPPR